MIHKNGDYIARIAYFQVCQNAAWSFDNLHICNIKTNLQFDVQGEALQKEYISGVNYSKTELVTLTELAKRFVSVGQLPFTVCFKKANGELRSLVGHLVSHEDLLGRSMVYDFEVTKGTPLRAVDHRTLQWLIYNDLRSILKEK